MSGSGPYREALGNLAYGVAFGEQQKTGLLLWGEGLEGGFKVELGEDLLLLLVGKALPNLKLGRAEGLGSLLDLLEVEIANAFAQRGSNPNGFEPPLLRPSDVPGPTSLRSLVVV